MLFICCSILIISSNFQYGRHGCHCSSRRTGNMVAKDLAHCVHMQITRLLLRLFDLALHSQHPAHTVQKRRQTKAKGSPRAPSRGSGCVLNLPTSGRTPVHLLSHSVPMKRSCCLTRQTQQRTCYKCLGKCLRHRRRHSRSPGYHTVQLARALRFSR